LVQIMVAAQRGHGSPPAPGAFARHAGRSGAATRAGGAGRIIRSAYRGLWTSAWVWGSRTSSRSARLREACKHFA